MKQPDSKTGRASELTALIDRISALKAERKAVILAHNYQRPEVQDIADFSGDSLELSRKAQNIDAEIVVFCGVHFMAETAALLSPEKTVLLPDTDAGCPMADMVDAEGLRKFREDHPGAIVVCYVNSTAAVKAESDVCCTSANAVEIVSRISPEKQIIFVPDQYLGRHVERRTGRKLILWPGYCPTHARILPKHVEAARVEYPDALIMVHPECRGEVAELADEVLSTGGMCRVARSTAKHTIVVGTETGLIHRLSKENPEKRFVPLIEQALCPNMKRITLSKVIWSLENLEHHITIDAQVAARARKAIIAMLEQGPIAARQV